MTRRPRFRCLPILAVVLFPSATLLAQGGDKQGEPALVTRSSIERMSPAHAKITQEDAERLRKTRKPLDPIPGLTDYRAIFHSHADDSAHTGGTRPEILKEAKKVGVNAIFLSDHYRPPADFINDSWRGEREGVLFIPGSETHGFLISPSHSIMKSMDAPKEKFIEAVTDDDGLIFLSHIEERVDHSMAGLTGMEIYNRHYDAKKDKAGVLSLIFRLTDPKALEELKESLTKYPDAVFAFHVEYPTLYMKKWDQETKTRRLTGVAANDCHHNQVLMVKMVSDSKVLVGTNVDRDEQMQSVNATLRPGIRTLTKGHKPGDIVAQVDLDPYSRSFQNVSTHILAPELTEKALRASVQAGRVYVSHDWICDPTGFRFEYTPETGEKLLMGSETPFKSSGKITAALPASGRIRLIRDGQVVQRTTGDRLEFEVKQPGVYRVEAWVVLDGEERPWIYSNPIYLR